VVIAAAIVVVAIELLVLATLRAVWCQTSFASSFLAVP
jgi:hypothetical protein